MTKSNQLPTLSADSLVTATGGASRASSSSSSNDAMLQQTMSTITDSLRDLKNQQNDSTSKMLPLLMAAKMMRDRG